jgi:hypothetical protein
LKADLEKPMPAPGATSKAPAPSKESKAAR